MYSRPFLLISFTLLFSSCDRPTTEQSSPLNEPESLSKSEQPLLNQEKENTIENSISKVRGSSEKLSSDFSSELKKQLKLNEAQVLLDLALLEGEHDYETIVKILIDHYASNITGGLDACIKLDQNIDLIAYLLPEMLSAYWDQSPEAAFTWLTENKNLQGTPYAVGSLGKKAGETDNPFTFFDRIVSSNLEDTLKSNFLAQLTKSWLQNDFNSAFQHINELESSPWLDQTIYEVIFEGGRANPKNTMLWAESITNEGLKRSAILETASQWSVIDSEGYEAWKKDAAVTEDLLLELP